METSRLTQKGQITVPKPLRDAMGWTLETPLTFIKCEDGVKIVEASESSEAVIANMIRIEWNGPSFDEIKELTRAEV